MLWLVIAGNKTRETIRPFDFLTAVGYKFSAFKLSNIGYFYLSLDNTFAFFLHFPHSLFSIPRIFFHPPRFPHPAFSTPRIFHTPHSILSTLRTFHQTEQAAERREAGGCRMVANHEKTLKVSHAQSSVERVFSEKSDIVGTN